MKSSHIERMELEKEELASKIKGLKKFLFETANLKDLIDSEQEENLKEQLGYMESYCSVLTKRINYDSNK